VQLGRGRPLKQGRKPTLRAVQGGPANPLPVTPASGAAGGGGEEGQRVNTTAGLSREGRGREGGLLYASVYVVASSYTIGPSAYQSAI
jgi:hypothetical protein